MKSFSHQNRKENIQKSHEEFFDLVIIGGGINGAGVARDAALRGMKVALVENKDFASGTSSRSSKLIHGGIRYLENFEFDLVFEALSERQRLFEIAPHLVHPLRFMIPLYKNGRVGMFKMGLGMWLYDALSLFQAPELHERLASYETMGRMPALQPRDLLGSYVYSDAYMDDDRLVHATLRSAHGAGACLMSYVGAAGVEFDNKGFVCAMQVRDRLSSQNWKIRGRHFVSTVGPWTDELGKTFFPEWKKRLRPTKGVHLTFEKKRLPLSSAVVMAAEKRIVFAIPRHEMVIVGTTDTDYSDSPENVMTEIEDVQYLLDVIRRYFPGANIEPKDIVASYAGVRPLVYDGAATEGKTSREHAIFTEPHGVTFVAGGKYTTYRLIAEQVVEHILRSFPIEDRVRFNRCQTLAPLSPWINEESVQSWPSLREELVQRTSLSKVEVQWLVDRHGHESLDLVDRYGLQSSYWQIEAHQAINSSMCLNLVDFYTRRVPLVLAYADHGLRFLHSILQVFQSQMGWSESKCQEEKHRLHEHLQHELAWKKHWGLTLTT